MIPYDFLYILFFFSLIEEHYHIQLDFQDDEDEEDDDKDGAAITEEEDDDDESFEDALDNLHISEPGPTPIAAAAQM